MVPAATSLGSGHSASPARIFNQTASQALVTCRCPLGGHSPPPAPAGDARSVAPAGMLLSRLSGGRQARPPLRRAREPRGSRLGLPSRTVPPKRPHSGPPRSGCYRVEAVEPERCRKLRAREHAAVQARQRDPLGPAARPAEGRERLLGSPPQVAIIGRLASWKCRCAGTCSPAS